MKCPFVIKVCSKCGELLVANTMNFRKQKKGKWGLRSSCKRCNKQYYEDNKEYISEYQKQWYEDNKERVSEHQKQYYEDNKEYISGYKKKWYEDNKEYISEYYKQYYEDNKEYISEYYKQYYEDNKEYYKQWYEDNKEHKKEYSKQYYKENPEKIFNKNNRRRLREENQGNGITKEQWLEMMKFFEFKCAYSGITLSKETRTIDHINPLSKGGLNEIWNCVPMIKKYNISKHANDMLDWYKQQEFYLEERLNKIYEWIEYAKNKYNK